MINNSCVSCYLEKINEQWEINLPASALSEDDIIARTATKKVYRPHHCFGVHLDYDVTRYYVERVDMENGKFAFPVYKYTRISDIEGDEELVGWCVKDKDPFELLYI